MKFQRFLFNMQIGQLSVAKYEREDSSITLMVESEGEAVDGYAQLDFDNQDAYIDWIDGLIGSRDEISADAEIVQDVIKVMKDRASQAVYDDRYSEKSTKKLVSFNTEKHSDLLEAIKSDEMSFSERCKELLIKHYELDI